MDGSPIHMDLTTSRLRDPNLNGPEIYHIRESQDEDGGIYLCLADAPDGPFVANAGKPITDKVVLEFEAPTWDAAVGQYHEVLDHYEE